MMQIVSMARNGSVKAFRTALRESNIRASRKRNILLMRDLSLENKSIERNASAQASWSNCPLSIRYLNGKLYIEAAYITMESEGFRQHFFCRLELSNAKESKNNVPSKSPARFGRLEINCGI